MGFNLGAIWNFLDGGVRSNKSGEPVNDLTSLSMATVFTACRVLADVGWVCQKVFARTTERRSLASVSWVCLSYPLDG
jgi:hypothetical protein